MAGVFGASHECAAASNPQLRLFKPTRAQSSTPLYMLSSPPTSFHNWSAASPVATSEAASPRVEASRPVAAPAAPAAGAGSVQQSLLDKFRSAAAS